MVIHCHPPERKRHHWSTTDCCLTLWKCRHVTLIFLCPSNQNLPSLVEQGENHSRTPSVPQTLCGIPETLQWLILFGTEELPLLPALLISINYLSLWNSSCMSWEEAVLGQVMFGASHAFLSEVIWWTNGEIEEPGNPDASQQCKFFLHISAGFNILPSWHYCCEDRMCQERVHWGPLRFWVVSRFKREDDWWEA